MAKMSQMDVTSTAIDVSEGDSVMRTQTTAALSADSWATIGLIIGFLIPIVVIEFGNVMTIAAFVTYRRLRRSKYIPVVSMAVADSLFGLMAIVFLVERHRHLTLPDEPAFSLTVVILSTLLADVTALHLVVLAVDRFVAVRFPMSYRRTMTSRRVSTMTVACWLVAVAVMSPYLIWMVQDPRLVTDANVTCYHFESDDGPVPLTFDYPIQFSIYIITTTILVALSLAVLSAATRSNWRRRFDGCACPTQSLVCCRWLNRSRSNDDDDAAERCSTNTVSSTKQLNVLHGRITPRLVGSRTYTMVTLINVAFIVTWAPYFIVETVQLSSISMCRSPAVRIAHLVTAEFGGFNAGLNFFIYAFVNRDFRTAYKLTLKKLLRCGRSMPISRAGSTEDMGWSVRPSRRHGNASRVFVRMRSTVPPTFLDGESYI